MRGKLQGERGNGMVEKKYEMKKGCWFNKTLQT
jgi:hypothetical protein